MFTSRQEGPQFIYPKDISSLPVNLTIDEAEIAANLGRWARNATVEYHLDIPQDVVERSQKREVGDAYGDCYVHGSHTRIRVFLAPLMKDFYENPRALTNELIKLKKKLREQNKSGEEQQEVLRSIDIAQSYEGVLQSPERFASYIEAATPERMERFSRRLFHTTLGREVEDTHHHEIFHALSLSRLSLRRKPADEEETGARLYAASMVRLSGGARRPLTRVTPKG